VLGKRTRNDHVRSFDASVAGASNTRAAFPVSRSIGINPNGLLRAFEPMCSRARVKNEISEVGKYRAYRK
jgi:hypothetical protein